ncbi:MAG: mitochondrial fission ELM1 family protein [Acidisphaera sp.]|nr:mitochondrial fission ELM1 family protein [Acidisphaera sp.]
MADASTGVSDVDQDGRPAGRVWVLDDPRAGGAEAAIGIAERLGTPFRRIPLSWNWLAHVAALSPHGSLLGLAAVGRGSGSAGRIGQGWEQAIGYAAPGRRNPPPVAGSAAPSWQEGNPAEAAWSRLCPASPALAHVSRPVLTLSSGSRSAAVALWLKARLGTRLVHCARPGLRGSAFDLLVVPRHEQPPDAANVLATLGLTHRLSPLLLRQARLAWQERLSHLPHPRIALLVGGPVRGTDLKPAVAHTLGTRIAGLAKSLNGSVLATTSRRTGAEATDALAAGLAPSLHVLYRWGEPGPNPYEAFLASADAIVVTGDSIAMLSEACATDAAVFVALPELAGAQQRRLHASLFEAGQARLLGGSVSPWPRTPLDEAGRVAAEIIRRFPLE